MPALHALGYAYFVLRLVAWGVRLSREPGAARRPADTLCWLLYPPCMRLGPVMLREQFLERLDGWDPRGRVPVGQVAQRLGLCLLGLVVLGVVMRQMPNVAGGAADFFAAPQDYSTGKLVRVLYLVPLQIYLMLWSYNELACGLSLWVGIRVDNNFNWLPRAASIKDFWRRWHITVGSWMRDYIYIPLGGNRGFVPLRYLAVFAYCGLWHGASLSFLAWGLSQALGLTIERVWERAWSRSRRGAPPTGRAWTLCAWLLTLHYQTLTILMFADFDHRGFRLVSELFGRLVN
jgi:D-alanyl-lipoteichoic acid acyltransferase DltB (MBOAT superfamily)